MPKKRPSSESSSVEPKNEGSDLFQKDEGTKRAKLASLSDKMLQDLPMELIESIFIQAVAMEVKDMKLAKSVWKGKADLAINRLSTVCRQWSDILATNYYQNQLNRILDGTVQKIRLEILQQTPLQVDVRSITSLKDEMFLLHRHMQRCAINVYDCSNLAEVKEVIPLPGLRPYTIAACNVSNCVYILNRKIYAHVSILRITRGNDDEHWSTVDPSLLITELNLPHPTFRVTTDGSLILSRQKSGQRAAIIVYDANGSLQHRIRLSPDIPWFGNLLPKSNGNIVLVSGRTKLMEIDMGGAVIRQYESSVNGHGKAWGDRYGRVLITDELNRMEVVDSEFNLLEFTQPQLGGGIQYIFPCELHYNRERNEMTAIVVGQNPQNICLTIFQLKDN